MTLFYSKKIFLFILIFLSIDFLYAARWPYIKMSCIQKNASLFSPKKYFLYSQKGLRKNRIHENMYSIFSYILSLPSLYIEKNSLQDIFFTVHKKCSIKVRVLLTKVEENTEWAFSSSEGFIVSRQDNKIIKKIKMAKVIIKVKAGTLFLNNKQIIHPLRLHSITEHGEYNGIMYDGDFIITPYKNTFLCINEVALEDYVSAVLRTESWPGWPLEVNKVFAIACRTYVMFKILEAKRSGRVYHVKNTNAHQTYRGKHTLPLLKKAVEETRGVILGFKNAPILAMFDCCCGGIIPAHIEDFNFNKVPYLARSYACNFCKKSSLYSWKISYERSDFELLLKQHFEAMQLSDIFVLKKDKAGLVTHVKLKGSRSTCIIPGKKLYSILKEIKSFHFDIQKKANTITFIGRGFGHHMGLCQWGARQMVREGWDYKSILRFYYPGSYFMHLI